MPTKQTAQPTLQAEHPPKPIDHTVDDARRRATLSERASRQPFRSPREADPKVDGE